MIKSIEQLKKWIVQNFWTREQVAGWANSQFWRRAIFRQTSDGAAHAGLPVALDAAGKLDSTFYDSADVVLLTGNQSVAGVKTLTDQSVMVTPDSAIANQANQLVLRSQRTTINTTNALIGGIDFQSNDTGLTAPGAIVARIQALARATHTSSVLDTAIRFQVTLATTIFEAMRISQEGYLGVGTAAPAGQAHVDQPSTTAAIPVLVLDQADLSEEFIEFDTTVGAGNPIDTAALGAYYGKVRVSVNGTFKYIALYDS